MRSAAFQTHFLKYMRHRISNRRSRRERQVNDPERHAQPSRSLLRHELTHSCDLERRPLDDIGDLGNIRVRSLRESRSNHARTAYAYIHHTVGFADPVKRARHKGIVLRRVAEYNELCRAEAIVVSGQLGAFADDMTHFGNSVHIDSGFGGADIYRRTHPLRLGKRLRNALDKRVVARTEALMHQRGISAEEIHAHLLCRPVEGVGDLDGILVGTSRRHHRCRSDGNALVYDRNTVLRLYFLTCFYKVSGISANLVVYFAAHSVYVAVGTIEKADTHSYGAYVQIFVLDHMYCFKNIFCIKHIYDSRQ